MVFQLTQLEAERYIFSSEVSESLLDTRRACTLQPETVFRELEDPDTVENDILMQSRPDQHSQTIPVALFFSIAAILPRFASIYSLG